MQDSLGDTLKVLEDKSTFYHDVNLPLYIRLDGRSFSKVTKKMEKPYSVDFISVMQATTEELMHEFSIDMGFCQSDEISLVLLPRKTDGFTYPFAGRQNKILSVFASAATQNFIKAYGKRFEDEPVRNIHFDARSISLTPEETALMFMWRHKDATRNAILQYAHNCGKFSKKSLHGVKTSQVLEMIEDAGVDWYYDVNEYFRLGTFFETFTNITENDNGVTTRKVLRKFTLDRSFQYV